MIIYQWMGSARLLYNLALSQRKTRRFDGTYATRFQQDKELPALKAAFDFFKDVG